MKCKECLFWIEAQGTKREDDMGGCTFGFNTFYPMFLEEDCQLKDIHKVRAEYFHSKLIKDGIIAPTTCIKIYHKREKGDVFLFDLAIVDIPTLKSDIVKAFADAYGLPTWQVIITSLYGNDDANEISMCEKLSEILDELKNEHITQEV